MSARLGERKRPRRLPSLSFGATTEYDRSDQPYEPPDPLPDREPARGRFETVHRGPLHRRPKPEGLDSEPKQPKPLDPIADGPANFVFAGSTAEAASPPTTPSASGQTSKTGTRSASRPPPTDRSRCALALIATPRPSRRDRSRASKRRAGTSTEASSNIAESTAGRLPPQRDDRPRQKRGRRPRRPGLTRSLTGNPRRGHGSISAARRRRS